MSWASTFTFPLIAPEITALPALTLANTLELFSEVNNLLVRTFPETIPLTKIFPSDRYRQIKQSVSPEQLLAACRVAGTHVHIGMANLKECITAYNILRKYLDYFCKLGDHSNGERLRLYKTMAKNWVPPEIKDAENFFEIAEKNSFVEDPRNCHWLIRISAHGTVELRMFGSYNYLSEVTDYAGMAVLALLDNGFNR